MHPLSGDQYQLTIYGCEMEQVKNRVDRNGWDFELSGWCQILSYSISPEISTDRFRIQDCSKSDQPRTLDSTTGPTSIFIARKHAEEPQKHIVYSSLHFDKESVVKWKTIFYERERENLTVVLKL